MIYSTHNDVCYTGPAGLIIGRAHNSNNNNIVTREGGHKNTGGVGGVRFNRKSPQTKQQKKLNRKITNVARARVVHVGISQYVVTVL